MLTFNQKFSVLQEEPCPSFIASCLFLIVIILYLVWICVVFRDVREKAKTPEFKESYSQLFERLDIDRFGGKTIKYHLIDIFRSILLSTSLVFLADANYF